MTLSPITSRAYILHSARTSAIQAISFGTSTVPSFLVPGIPPYLMQQVIGLRGDIAAGTFIGNAPFRRIFAVVASFEGKGNRLHEK